MSSTDTAAPTTATATTSRNKTTVSEKDVRPSVNLRMIRHAESKNNEVYRNARYIYRGGTPDFDEAGWWEYVETHRSADPDLSDAGLLQAKLLSAYLAPHLLHQASQPVHIICSPMRRTLLTIRPTIHALTAAGHPVHVAVQAFYYESDGCHTRDEPVQGLTPSEITDLVHQDTETDDQRARCTLEFVGFPDPQRGWYCQATGAETRAQSEERAAKFFLWLCHTLDGEISDASQGATAEGKEAKDIFDAGVRLPGEEDEMDADYFQPRLRRRRTYLLMGHGDFMSLVLKRIMAGYGYAVEHDGIPHRSAMVHHNTGMTELEYFGHGRFLCMHQNATPHLPTQQLQLLSGGGLKDGWSYIVPTDETVLRPVEVNVAFADELDDHVREQSQALRALYLGASSSEDVTLPGNDALTVQEELVDADDSSIQVGIKHFVVQRGHQVVAVATYSDQTGIVTDLAVQPGATGAREALIKAVQEHVRTLPPTVAIQR
jgi:broad specificity phosphatase PhoE